MSNLIFYLVIVAFVAFVSATIVSSRYKLSLAKRLGIFGVFIFFIMFIMPLISNYFVFHHLYDEKHPLHSRSITKNESIKRKVFVCDLKLVPSTFHFNDTMSMAIKDAWIEKDWSEGFWFWTTLPGINENYNVTVVPQDVKGTWHIKRFVNKEYLGYGDNLLRGSLNALPQSDTLSYFVLRTNEFDFNERNILGKIKFVLVRK